MQQTLLFKDEVNQNTVQVMAIFIHSAGTNGSWYKKALSWGLTLRLKKRIWSKNQGKAILIELQTAHESRPNTFNPSPCHAPKEMFTDHRNITYSDLHGNSDSIHTIISFRDAEQAVQKTRNLLYANPFRLETHFISQTAILNRYEFKTHDWHGFWISWTLKLISCNCFYACHISAKSDVHQCSSHL